MKTTFRARMGTLHTWAGVLFGALLFAIFWTGSLSVFDEEIDRWMMPDTRLAWDAAAPRLALDRDVRPLLERRAATSPYWMAILPSDRLPFLTLSYGTGGEHGRQRDRFDPRTLALLPHTPTLGATGFLYPFHHNLTIRWHGIGTWIVGAAGMAMLCLLVSGLVIHRRLFAEFFTLRFRRPFGRSDLDVHNLTGIVLLPFHILITLSGLMIAVPVYFPAAYEALYADGAPQAASAAETPQRAFLREALGRKRLPAAGQPAELASLDAMVAEAERHWGEATVYLVRVNNLKDAAGNVVLRRTSDDTVTKVIDNFRFAAATGAFVERFQASPTVNVWNFIAGTHYIQFRHWLLRWLYFLGGIGGCAMIATGLFFWTQARRKKHQGQGHSGVGLVEAVSIAGVCGILAATLAFFLANRALPRQDVLWNVDREQWEVWTFHAVWCTSALHALVRIGADRTRGHLRAWRDQCWGVAGLAVLAVAANWLTTGDHLLATVVFDPYWPVAGMDLSLLAAAALAVVAARALGRRACVAGPYRRGGSGSRPADPVGTAAEIRHG